MENIDDLKAFVVPVAGCPPLNVHGSLGCHSNIVLHATNFSRSHKPNVCPTAVTQLHNVLCTRGSLPVCVRRLFDESAAVFLAVQKCDRSVPETVRHSILLKLSRRYRACLRASIECVLNTDSADSQMHKHILIKSEMVWHLCEILMVDQQKGSALLYQMMEWVKAQAPQFDKSSVDVLQAESRENHPEYWNTVYGYILQGRLDSARKLLRLHGGFGSEAFVSVDELLQKMPTFSSWSTTAASELEFRWRHWQDECIRRLEDREFDFHPRLQTLVKLLCGDAPTFEDMAHLLGSWYHLMISFLLFTKPWAAKSDLRYAAVDALEVFGGATLCSPLDGMLLAVMEGDPVQLMRSAVPVFSDGWLPAHLADLLQRALPAVAQQLIDLRRQLLLQVGAALCGRRQLWQLGLLYLDHAGPVGRAHAALYLERVPPRDDSTARKIIQAAERRGLSHVARSVSRVMGVRCVRQQRLGSALAWALRAEDAALASHLADGLVHSYTNTGRLDGVDFIDSLGSCILISDRLMFLGKYREFHRLYGQMQMKEAGSLLVTLMSEGLAPRYFWMTLLTDVLTLLGNKESIISTEQTHQLLDCLELLKRHGELDESEDRVKQIRRCLCHNLARSFITDSSAGL